MAKKGEQGRRKEKKGQIYLWDGSESFDTYFLLAIFMIVVKNAVKDKIR